MKKQSRHNKAYDKQVLFDKCMQTVRENNLFFIEDIADFQGISKETIYKYFPIGSNEMDALKVELQKNKAKTKSSIRAKLYKSSNTGQLLALYRLICSSDERRMLNQNYIDVTTNNQSIGNGQSIIVIKPPKKEQQDAEDRDRE